MPDEAALYIQDPLLAQFVVRRVGVLVARQPNQIHGYLSFPLGGEKKRDPSPRYYIQRGQEPSGRSGTAGLPLTQERRAGSIARVPIVAILM